MAMLLDCKPMIYLKWCSFLFSLICVFFLVACKPSHEDLYNAVSNGDFLTVRKIIETGINLKEYDAEKDFLLITVRNNQLDISEYLIKKGVEVNVVYDTGFPLSFHLALNKKDSLLQEMIKNGLNINPVDSELGNLLNLAVEFSTLETMKLLVRNGIDLDVKDSDGRTPLSMAIFNGYTEKVKYLIENGADVNYRGYGDADIWTELAFYTAPRIQDTKSGRLKV